MQLTTSNDIELQGSISRTVPCILTVSNGYLEVTCIIPLGHGFMKRCLCGKLTWRAVRRKAEPLIDIQQPSFKAHRKLNGESSTEAMQKSSCLY